MHKQLFEGSIDIQRRHAWLKVEHSVSGGCLSVIGLDRLSQVYTGKQSSDPQSSTVDCISTDIHNYTEYTQKVLNFM